MSKHHARPLWHSIRAVWVDDSGGNVRCPSQIYSPSWFIRNWLLPKDGCFLHHSPGSCPIEPWNDHNLTVLSTETLNSSFWIIVFVMTKSLPFFFPCPPKKPMATQGASLPSPWLDRVFFNETQVELLGADAMKRLKLQCCTQMFRCFFLGGYPGPVIMVQWNITLNERKQILEGPIFRGTMIMEER